MSAVITAEKKGWEKEDTEAAVSDFQVPQVHPEVVSGDEGLEVGVDRDGVDVVCVGIAEYTSGCSLNHQVHRLQHRHLEVDTGHLKGNDKNKYNQARRGDSQ